MSPLGEAAAATATETAAVPSATASPASGSGAAAAGPSVHGSARAVARDALRPAAAVVKLMASAHAPVARALAGESSYRY